MFSMLRSLSQLIGFNPDGPESIGKMASALKDCDPKYIRTVVKGKKICADGMQTGIWDSQAYPMTRSIEEKIGIVSL